MEPRDKMPAGDYTSGLWARYNILLHQTRAGRPIGPVPGEFNTAAALQADARRGQDLPPVIREAVALGELSVEAIHPHHEVSDEDLMSLVEGHEAGADNNDTEFFTVKRRSQVAIGIKSKKGRAEEWVKARLKVELVDPDPEESLENVKARPQLVAEILNGPRKGEMWSVASFYRGKITMFDPQSDQGAETYTTDARDTFTVVAQPNGKMNVYEIVDPSK